MTNTQGSHAPTLCPPGTRMLLEVAGFQDKLASICVGHIRPRFVVTTAPIVPEHNREAVHQMLYPDNTVIVRFLLEGTVMGFSAKIIRSLQVPFPLLFFTYPTRLECLDLRRHRRVPCCIPAETEVGTNATPGMIVDLSLTGCQFSACLTEGTATPPQIGIDDSVVLRCPLFGQDRQAVLPSAVKRVGLSEKRLDIGLKFKELSPEIHAALNGYIHHALSVLD